MATRRMERERWVLLHNVIRTLEPLMAALGLVWTLLLVLEFTRGFTPGLATGSRTIWAIFAIDFVVELAVAPRKLRYLRSHWLAAISLDTLGEQIDALRAVIDERLT
jgi:voltage-gated potassium channel